MANPWVVLRNLVFLAWQDAINFLHAFDSFGRHPELIQLAKQLRRDGIITLQGFMGPSACDIYREQIEHFVEQRGSSDGLTSLMSSEGASITVRNAKDSSAPDHGMIDVFNIQRAVPGIRDIDDSMIQLILQAATGQHVNRIRTNAYVNVGVAGTRGFHIDNVQPTLYKAFLYLTDVTDETDGCYSLVRGSHHFCFRVYLNLFLNMFTRARSSTDMPIVPHRRVRHALGPRGTLILSSQNAIHRGMPQRPGKRRVALVFNYLVTSRLNHINKTARLNMVEAKAEQATVGALA
jgi:hypothetical protein